METGVSNKSSLVAIEYYGLCVESDMKSDQTQSIGDDNCAYFKNVLTPGKKNDTDILTARTTLLSMIDELSALVAHCKDVTTLNAAKPRIQTATTVVKPLPYNKVTIPIKRIIPPNSNNETQLKFFSSKKRRAPCTKTISKPTKNEIIEQRKKLKKEEPTLCGV